MSLAESTRIGAWQPRPDHIRRHRPTRRGTPAAQATQGKPSVPSLTRVHPRGQLGPMIARIEVYPTRVRLLLQHGRKDRLVLAYRETIRVVTIGISVAEFEPEFQRWWIAGKPCWILRVWLMGDPPGELPVVLAEELTRRGFRVVVGRPERIRMIGRG